MKNLIICLLFSCSFLLGNSTLTACELGGGAHVIIVAPKTGQTVFSIELPKAYQYKKNKIEISIRQGEGNVIYSEVGENLIIALPSTLSGAVNVTLKFENFVINQQIVL